jgi:hypothetical protein
MYRFDCDATLNQLYDRIFNCLLYPIGFHVFAFLGFSAAYNNGLCGGEFRLTVSGTRPKLLDPRPHAPRIFFVTCTVTRNSKMLHLVKQFWAACVGGRLRIFHQYCTWRFFATSMVNSSTNTR